MADAFIEGFGILHTRGIYSKTGFSPWDINQSGAVDVRRDQVLKVPHPTFGKLSLPDKLAFSAASLALSEYNEPGGDMSALCLAIPYGSLVTDLEYTGSVRNGFPSPAIFSATLPSSSVAEIAIYYKFKGPDRVFSGGDSPALAALDSAVYFVKSGRAKRALSVAVWAAPVQPGHKQTGSAFASAIFLSSEPSRDGLLRLSVDLKGEGIDGNELEQDLLMHLSELIMYRQPVNISVSRKGFKGYICIEE